MPGKGVIWRKTNKALSQRCSGTVELPCPAWSNFAVMRVPMGVSHSQSGLLHYATRLRKRVFLNRLLQVEAGNFGDVASVGDGVSELRVHVGAGYRVYFGQHGKAVVVLLCGGDKSHQVADVRRAKQYWLELKTRLS
jgi:putative addiction module killer protein